MWQRTGTVPRALAGLPPRLPMVLLSAYTAVPLLSVLGAALCPSTARLARGLAASLGCLLGTVVGAFLDRGKTDAARCSVLRLLSDHMQDAMAVDELRSLVSSARLRFGVAAGQRAEAFEDTALCGVYEAMMTEMLDGPENDVADLPALRRLKAALDLDGIVVGFAHKRVAKVLISKGYSGVEGEEMRRAVDKLLFLSERAFSDDEPAEARIYEMNRLRNILKITDREARQRIAAVSRALYQQNLSAVASEVDAHTGEALAGASKAFGLPIEEAARMNVEMYRQIAGDLLAGDRLAPGGKATLERAQGVLQLGDRAAATAFAAVAAPLLQKTVEEVARSLVDGATVAPAEKVKAAAATLSGRREELGLPPAAAEAVVAEGLLAAMRSFYNGACRRARSSESEALQTLDRLIAMAASGDAVLAELHAAGGGSAGELRAPLTMEADQAAARRLYGLFLERDLSGDAAGAAPSEELARVLELSEADEEAARVEVCQPRLRELLVDTIERSEAAGGTPLTTARAGISSEMARFRLPPETMEETSMEVYKSRVAKLADRVLKVTEKDALDAARAFLQLSAPDVRRLHLKAFGKTYEQSVREAMGRDGNIAPEAREALEQLRERSGISEADALQIFYGVVEGRLRTMMVVVQEAWEEATYTKEALTQIYKERGKDIGDDPSADGSGGELGIKDSPPLEGVRGFKLMTELIKVSDFYLGNKVLLEGEGVLPDDAYPVVVGKYLEDKSKEEMYGIFAWNAVTCQDSASRDRWERAKPHVGGILGLSQDTMQKVLIRMVSRWCNMFIKQKISESGQLGEDDISTLTNWVPSFFGIDEDVTKEMVQSANKGMLQSKALKLLNLPRVTPDDVQQLLEDVKEWGLRVEKDLELTKPQLRSLFRVEVTAALEDPDLNDEQKRDVVAGGRESFGLGAAEAAEELRDLIHARCKGCLVNAVGDLMQGNEAQAVREMQRLELVAGFAQELEGVELRPEDWEVAPAMRRRLLETYAGSATASENKRVPDVKMLERTLGLGGSS